MDLLMFTLFHFAVFWFRGSHSLCGWLLYEVQELERWNSSPRGETSTSNGHEHFTHHTKLCSLLRAGHFQIGNFLLKFFGYSKFCRFFDYSLKDCEITLHNIHCLFLVLNLNEIKTIQIFYFYLLKPCKESNVIIK